ncbi:hypothetical protein ABW19_dt0205096 [Dactylella cylindrospora]|nr:hypothetical protein ABW19_dt0205096 [Dactylella cylindrospora]
MIPINSPSFVDHYTYTIRYTGFGFQSPPILIYHYDKDRGYPSVENGEIPLPAFEMSRVKDKLQLSTADAAGTNITVLSYLKNQKIEIRDRSELFPDSQVLQTIEIEWYSKYSEPKLFDMKFPGGRVYRWWSAGDGVFELVDKSKDSITKDAVLARIAGAGGDDKTVLLISIAAGACESGGDLTDKIILSSAFGVLKRCERNLVKFGWFDAGGQAKSNGFIDIFTGLGTIFQ